MSAIAKRKYTLEEYLELEKNSESVSRRFCSLRRTNFEEIGGQVMLVNPVVLESVNVVLPMHEIYERVKFDSAGTGSKK